MKIILEGPDATGKTTLMRKLARVSGYPYYESRGPEKYPGEILERLGKYKEMDDLHFGRTPYILDRHPAISHNIYGRFAGMKLIPPKMVSEAIGKDAILVYCRPSTFELVNHQENEKDSLEHLSLLEKHHSDICRLYDSWGLRKAHFIYRYGDYMALHRTVKAIIALTKGQYQ